MFATLTAKTADENAGLRSAKSARGNSFFATVRNWITCRCQPRLTPQAVFWRR